MTISPATGLPAPAAGHPYPTAPTDLGPDALGGAARTLAASLGRAIFDRREAIELVVISVLAGGHVLLEDLPGTGKTTLARALAQSLGGELRRVQATADLLPADITGSSIWDASRGGFVFAPGPIFSNVLLVDELNRTPPRTQSAFLEAMDEGRSRSTASDVSCRTRSSSWRPRTRSSSTARTRCRRVSWTVSPWRCSWGATLWRRSGGCCMHISPGCRSTR